MASIERRGDKYVVRYDTYTNGVRSTTKRAFDRAQEAKDFKREVEAALRGGDGCLYSRQTLKDYLAQYFETYCSNYSGNTLHCSKGYMERFIIPRIGNVRLRDLKTITIQKAFNSIKDTPMRPAKTKQVGNMQLIVEPEKYYSPKTLANIMGVLSAALESAVTVDHLIPFNPCKAVSLPKTQDFEQFSPTESQLVKLNGCMKASRYYEAALADALLGLRRSECLGLFWSDIDFEAHSITIRRALIYDESKHALMIKDTKSKNSRRTLAMPPDFETVLMALRSRRNVEEKQVDKPFAKSEFVFTDEIGRPIRPTNLSKEFKKIAVAAGVPKMRLHDLRGATATHLLRAGLSPKAVQGILGHQDARFTLRKYAAVLDDDRTNAAYIMQKLYSGKNGK